MDYSPNETAIEVLREDAFVGTYFRDIYSSINGNGTKIQGKNLII